MSGNAPAGQDAQTSAEADTETVAPEPGTHEALVHALQVLMLHFEAAQPDPPSRSQIDAAERILKAYREPAPDDQQTVMRSQRIAATVALFAHQQVPGRAVCKHCEQPWRCDPAVLAWQIIRRYTNHGQRDDDLTLVPDPAPRPPAAPHNGGSGGEASPR